MNSHSETRRHAVTLLGPPGLGKAVGDEVTGLGADCQRVRPGAVEARADTETLYRILLSARSVGRVLLPISDLRADSDEALYRGVAAHDWEREIPVGATIAVDFRGTGGWLKNSMHGARRIKDAVVDRIRDSGRPRPNVATDTPDILIHARLHRGRVQLYRDLGGGSLHQRGYRGGDEGAPLKEHLAAAMLIMADWPRRADNGEALLDPLCGSGTLVIEAALMAARMPARRPDACRGLGHWPGHDLRSWNRICRELEGQVRPPLGIIAGSDQDKTALTQAARNAHAAGVAAWVRWDQASLEQAQLPDACGLVVANLPYGQRVGDRNGISATLVHLGRRLRGDWCGTESLLLAGGDTALSPLGLAPERHLGTRNGALECHLMQFPGFPPQPDPQGEAFANRLRKNHRHLAKRFRRQGTDAFRCYDSDLPEFPGRIELLGEQVRLVPGAPGRDPEQDQRRVAAMVHQSSRVLDIPGERIHVCPPGIPLETAVTAPAREAGVRVSIRPGNAAPDLDPRGRLLRARAAEGARDGAFLQLYAKHAAGALQAAQNGASESLSLVVSSAAHKGIEGDLAQHGLDPQRHRAAQLQESTDRPWFADRPWQRILLTPAEGGEECLALDQVHQWLTACLRHLAPDGCLLAWYPEHWPVPEQLPAGMVAQELTHQMVPEDCRRDPAPGRFFQITAPRAQAR